MSRWGLEVAVVMLEPRVGQHVGPGWDPHMVGVQFPFPGPGPGWVQASKKKAWDPVRGGRRGPPWLSGWGVRGPQGQRKPSL